MAFHTDRFKYDVFLSFRGEDTRYGFTGNLKKALDYKGVRTFIDDEELQKGDEITPSLLRVIEESQIAIIVLSKNYASSSFCLQELSKILDSMMKDKVGRSILPVFYKVDPSDVRKLKRSYGEAMDKHDDASSSSHNKWKDSLHKVANLCGFHYKKGDGYEHEFIGKIVEQVLRNIKPVVLPVGDYLVGLEHQKQHVMSLLNVGSNDTVHMVGIHGIGGIGKTTLALEVYNSIVRQFQGSCFLEKVRENSNKYGLVYLQKILLSQIVGEKNMELTSVGQGISILQQRLHNKKVLLLIDDVDNLEQLEAVAGRSAYWFGPGSRVIITTRDKRLLTRHEVERTYEVKGLNDEDAFDLVGWKALKNEYSPSYKNILSTQKNGKELMDVHDKVFSGYAHVLKRVVAYASGLPLALEVIGSHFFKKTVEECRCALDRYERVPNKKIQTTLQLSFDALQEEEKFVFLDIACCFKGWKLTRVEEILHAHHGDIMKDHINVLVEKSLIKISEYGNVTLHDLVEDMGKEIVRQESPEDPGKRSRLWSSRDITQVLKENTGSSKIEIICLDRWIRVQWVDEAFKKMENLKTLIIRDGEASKRRENRRIYFLSYNVIFPKHLPKSLRVLECCNPFEWEGFLTKKFQNMKVLNLDRSDYLAQIPDISCLPNLEQFSIQNCKQLIAIDKSVGLFRKLKILRFIRCIKIRSVPPLSLASLEELELSHCFSLESFPLMVNGFGRELKILRVISCTKIRIIPSLILASLEELNLSNCTGLESFSHVVDGLGDKLKTMSVRGCSRLTSIPPLKLNSLETLDISCCDSLESFPLVVDGFLGKLKTLNVYRCRKLSIIPPLKFDSLEELAFSYCCSLERFPPVVDGFLGKLKTLLVEHCINLRSIPLLKLNSLETLVLSCCDSLESFPPVLDGFLGKLKTLNVNGCPSLKNIPPLKLDSLETLYLLYCDRLESFPLVVDKFLGKLKTLNVKSCPNLMSIPPLKLDLLEELDFSNCYRLESFPFVVDGFLGKLKTMCVKSCQNLKSIPPLKLDSLEKLDLSYCYKLELFPLVKDGYLGKLKILLVTSCHSLWSIPPLKLDSLEKLDLSNCCRLKSFPCVVDGLLDRLKFLSIEYCIMLQSIPPLRLTSLEQFNLSHCLSLESFPEILGEMRNIPRLVLDETPIKELPFPFIKSYST